MMITELEGLFRRLVREIVAVEPERIHRAMTVGEVTGTYLPYRVARRTIDVHAADDYETLLVRLFAGEGGMVHLHDPAVRDRFVTQAASSLPDLDILRREADARFDFWTEALAYAMGPGDTAYAPPEATIDPPEPGFATPEDADAIAADDDPDDELVVDVLPAGGPRCGYCGGLLPEDRAVNFCPHCGQSQTGPRCPECRNEVEEGWRHCVTCGFRLSPP